MNNDRTQVTSVEEYNKQMKNGLNKFLEHGDSELVLNEKPENSNQYVTLTITNADIDIIIIERINSNTSCLSRMYINRII